MDIGSSLNSKVMVGRLKNKKTTNIAQNLRNICIKRGLEGIYDRFQKDSTFREWIELEKSVSRWTRTRRKISPIE